MSDDEKFDGLKNLAGVVGQIPTRGIFIAQFIGTSTLNSFIFGAVGGFVGQAVLGVGPILPFLVGSWTGFTLACVHTWQRDSKKAVIIAQRYPRLVQHYLNTEFANDCGTLHGVPTKEDMMKSLLVRTRMILCTYAMQPAIDEIVKRRTEALRDEYASTTEEA